MGTGSRFRRLTSVDLMFLRLESTAWPCHFGGLAVLEGTVLLDESGELRIEEIRDRLVRRLIQVPDLRRRIHVPGLLQGGPCWVDDDRFDLEHHFRVAAVASPGGSHQFLKVAARVYETPLHRDRPLWELWFLTGLSDDRIGVMLKLHHAMADGLAAVAIMGSLFDLEPDSPDPDLVPWTPESMPGGWVLFADNLSDKIRTLRCVLSGLAHPMRVVGQARAFVRLTRRFFAREAAPRSSLNEPVQKGRRIGFLRLDLATMKQAARAHEGTVNDVILALWAGGLRQLVMSRGEPAADLELITGMPVSLRSAPDTTVSNQVGTMVLPLPTWESDVQRRLNLIVARTRKVKAEQRPAAIMGYMAGLAASPIGRYFTTHQRASNVIVTNVIGPPVSVYVLGARVLEILPIIELIGNIGLTLCAFSYAGQMFMVVTADAEGFPDLGVLMEGMERDWHVLAGKRITEPVSEGSG